MLCRNSVKDLGLTKNVREIGFEGVCGELGKKMFSETITHKIFETNSGFRVK